MSRISICFLVIVVLISTISAEQPSKDRIISSKSANEDYTSYIDGNQLLMFVSNMGILASDIDRQFGRTDGLYYPYTSVDDILLGNSKVILSEVRDCKSGTPHPEKN